MFRMNQMGAACVRTVVTCGLVVLGVASGLGAQEPPTYTVDPFWPKPLPNKWIMQQVPTLVVDNDDHIWVFNRSRGIRPDENGASTTPPRTDCCIAGPAVLEFDTEGNLLNAWGGPGYVPNWPREQTIAVDGEGNVWISGTRPGSSILKFSRDGKLLWDFGRRAPPVPEWQTPPPLVENNQQTDILISNNRVQVFTKQGEFVTQFWIHPSTPARGPECGGPGNDTYGPCGTVFNLAFSADPEQTYVFVADGANNKIWIVERQTGTTVGSIGDNGRMAGMFHFVDGVATDSQGNIYTGEVETGKRIQKFVPVN